MTLTTGLSPVGSPTADAALGVVDATRDALALPASGRRPVGWLVVALDVVAGALASALGVSLPSAWALPVTASVILVWPALLALSGAYSRLAEDPYAVRARAVLAAGAALALLGWCVLALTPTAATAPGPRGLAVTSLVVAASAPAVSIVLRCLVPLVVPRRPLRAVVVGQRSQVRGLLAEATRGTRHRHYEPVAICLPGPAGEAPDSGEEAWPVPACHDAEQQLLDVVRLHHADAVVVAPSDGIGPAELRRWGAWLQAVGVDLVVSTGLRDVTHARISLARMGGSGLLRVRHAPLDGPARLVKEAVDRVVALLLLVLLSPVLLVIALLIRRDSPGPALFRQTRVGHRGRLFTVYKLRTMCADADRLVDDLAHENESDQAGVLFKIKRDPRITRLGAQLRALSLDELPQLINVVRGEMSLIGPRPALPREVQAYDADLRRRLDVKPGMTGLWQVSGRSDLAWEDTVRLDLQYVDNWSWSLDAAIAVRTAAAVLSRRGAY